MKLRRTIQVSAGVAALVAMNFYVARELFTVPAWHMNAMHGSWIALARLWGFGWWPYWDCGMPVEHTYAPLVPWLTAGLAWLAGSHHMAFQWVVGAVYCLAPAVLLVAAWRMTGSVRAGFASGLLYSLFAPSQLVVPDAGFAWEHLWGARRLYQIAVWDEAPHLAALALLPLLVVCLRRGSVAISALVAAAMSLASAFGPILAAIAVVCLGTWRVGAIAGVWAWCIAAPFLSPSLVMAMRTAAPYGPEGGWTWGSLAALGGVALGLVAMRRTHFAIQFAWLALAIPVLQTWFGVHFLPQPNRYKMELDLAVALAIPLAARAATARTVLCVALAAVAVPVTIHQRRWAKHALRTPDAADSVEYRAAIWVRDNLPGVRVMMPGSMALWTNAFSDVHQFAGGSWSMSASPVQLRGLAAVHGGDIGWLQSHGVGAIAVSTRDSSEFWKPYANPERFDALPVLWSYGGVTIRSVPSISDVGLEWLDRNHVRIRANSPAGGAVSVPISHHPRWRAKVGGRELPTSRDSLGLISIQPDCRGPCEVDLFYHGGWELRVLWWLSGAAVPALVYTGLRARR